MISLNINLVNIIVLYILLLSILFTSFSLLYNKTKLLNNSVFNLYALLLILIITKNIFSQPDNLISFILASFFSIILIASKYIKTYIYTYFYFVSIILLLHFKIEEKLILSFNLLIMFYFSIIEKKYILIIAYILSIIDLLFAIFIERNIYIRIMSNLFLIIGFLEYGIDIFIKYKKYKKRVNNV